MADEGFEGTVVRVAITGISADVSTCGGASVRVGAGENWDDFVAEAVDREWSGVEALSGIPGSVGATPIQNVGAYGAEVSQTITSVRTWDRSERTQRTFPLTDCGFGYRTSRFKREPGRYVVLEVGYQFTLGSRSQPVAYAELARRLGTEAGVPPPRRSATPSSRSAAARAWCSTPPTTTRGARARSSPTRSSSAEAAAGSPRTRRASRWPTGGSRPAPPGSSSTPGYGKGFGNDRASLSTKHVLALTNRGGATAADLVAVARRGARRRGGALRRGSGAGGQPDRVAALRAVPSRRRVGGAAAGWRPSENPPVSDCAWSCAEDPPLPGIGVVSRRGGPPKIRQCRRVLGLVPRIRHYPVSVWAPSVVWQGHARPAGT